MCNKKSKHSLLKHMQDGTYCLFTCACTHINDFNDEFFDVGFDFQFHLPSCLFAFLYRDNITRKVIHSVALLYHNKPEIV